jgi:hypothetical protein
VKNTKPVRVHGLEQDHAHGGRPRGIGGGEGDRVASGSRLLAPREELLELGDGVGAGAPPFMIIAIDLGGRGRECQRRRPSGARAGS